MKNFKDIVNEKIAEKTWELNICKERNKQELSRVIGNYIHKTIDRMNDEYKKPDNNFSFEVFIWESKPKKILFIFSKIRIWNENGKKKNTDEAYSFFSINKDYVISELNGYLESENPECAYEINTFLYHQNKFFLAQIPFQWSGKAKYLFFSFYLNKFNASGREIYIKQYYLLDENLLTIAGKKSGLQTYVTKFPINNKSLNQFSYFQYLVHMFGRIFLYKTDYEFGYINKNINCCINESFRKKYIQTEVLFCETKNKEELYWKEPLKRYRIKRLNNDSSSDFPLVDLPLILNVPTSNMKENNIIYQENRQKDSLILMNVYGKNIGCYSKGSFLEDNEN